MLVWTGDMPPTFPPAFAPETVPARPPQAYTPRYLAEKILTSRAPWKASASRSPCCLPT